MALSTLGIVHTVLSLIPLGAGITAFVRDGQIRTDNGVGRTYLWGMVASIVTSFGLSRAGGFNPGHAIGILALIVMGVALAAPKVLGSARMASIVRTVSMSFSFLLLLIPAVNETLTRVPVEAPLATGPDSPAVQRTILTFFVLFLAGVAVQWRRISVSGGR